MTSHRLRSADPFAGERGIAVVTALLTLSLLSIMGVSLITLSLTESQIASNESDLKKAFFAAEAGIQEAMYRMRFDPASFTDEADTSCNATADPVVVGFVQGGALTIPSPDPGNANFWKYNTPSGCSWTYNGSNTTGYGNYFGGNAANLDSAGRTFTSSGAAHGAGATLGNASLTNTASDPRSYTVTVAPVVGYVGGWQYVDQFGVPSTDVAQNPLFKVTSTGIAKTSQKILSAMIRRTSITLTPKGTLEANTNINIQSASAIIDGRNYDCNGNNPAGDNNFLAATTPTGTAGISINKPQNLQCDNGTGLTNCGGTSGAFPDTIGALLLRDSTPAATQSQINALDAFLESIKIDPAAHPELLPSSAFHGILYVDGDYAKPPDGSTGVLIVHHRDAGNHDVATLGNFNTGTFRGLIIADKINKINGNAQIIGAIFGFGNGADGVAVDDVTGTPNIKYSQCAIDTYVSQGFPFHIVSGTWHEQ